MKYIHSIFFFILLFSLWYSCKEKSIVHPVQEQNPVIQKVILKPVWNINSQKKYKVEIKAFDLQGVSDLDTVVSIMVMDKNSGNLIFEDTLYDDGSFYREDGDTFGKDGSFCNLYSVADIDPSVRDLSDYTFRFQVKDKKGNAGEPADTDVRFVFDHFPEITNILSAPDSLLNGDREKTFQIAVYDSDGLDDIIDAYFTGHLSESGGELFKNQMYNDGTHGDQLAGDSIFTTTIDSSFAIAKMGLYYLKFYVVDSLEETNDVIPDTTIYIENGLGIIEEIFMADTLVRPTTSDSRRAFQIAVATHDPQGPKDIETVYFQSIKPDGSYGSEGAYFYLYDDGNKASHDDEEAEDGIFSNKLYLEKQNDAGTYKFLFYLRDKIGRSLGPVIDSIVVQ
jgi:hypothetical protein